MKIRILRRKSPEAPEYWESFNYEGPLDISVAGLLDSLNYSDDIKNDKGEKTDRIGWECSCLQGVCGACAMVINDVPALACETFLTGIKGDSLTLRPLRKFPVIHDLTVDRTGIMENLKKANVYIGEYHQSRPKEHRHQYDVAKCLKCGLCLEVCPNYTNGNTFYGALFANDCYLASARNGEKAAGIKKVYDRHFGNACSKALSCVEVCPANLPTLASMARMNRMRKHKNT